MLEVHRYPLSDHGLDLPDPPIRLVGMLHEVAGLQKLVHGTVTPDPRSGRTISMSEHDLTAMVSARLCHDLVSPLGAIGNGLELLELSSGGSGEEIALISDSLGSALAKLRFFRVAFGPAESSARIRGEEVSAITDAMFSGRVTVVWSDLPDDVARPLIRLMFLAILCIEKSLPMGGAIRASIAGDAGTLCVEGRRVAAPEDLWAHVTEGRPVENLRSDAVQFALLRHHLEANEARLTAELSETGATIMLGAPATLPA